jgi:hypothetical protein
MTKVPLTDFVTQVTLLACLTDFTTHFITTIMILAVVSLGFQLCQLNIGGYDDA